MEIYTYSVANDTASGVVNISELHKEILSLSLEGFAGINNTADVIEVCFNDPIDASNQLKVTTCIGIHTSVSTTIERTCENCSNFIAK